MMQTMIKEAEKVLYKIDKILEESERLDIIYRTYLREIARSFNVKRVSLMLIDETRRELFIHESEGLKPELKSKARVKLGEGIAGWVAEKGEGVVVHDIEKSRLFREQKKDRGFRSGSFISIPIKLRGRVYGVLNIAEKKDKTPFSTGELRFLEIFGMQLAVLLENQWLRREIEWLER
ncbi:MAG: GAF domain-containing protein, partial [Candidatus Omnitrophica bacterium]|nr:GAF domain-containing protein [Candidatus Omnitrophota bacterium]